MRREVLRRVRATPDAVVLFDVDSTLLSTAARHLAILQDFAAEAADPELVAFVNTLGLSDFGWTVSGPLMGTVHEREELLESLSRFWVEGFFSSRYLAEDRAVAGAVDFVNQVHRAGAWVYYLTARDLSQMGAATAASLLDLGFPLLHGRTTLHLKPTRAITDTSFKAAALRDVRRAGTVVATYENDPRNANLFAETFPDAVNVLLDTVCSPDAPEPSADLIRVPDFQRRA